MNLIPEFASNFAENLTRLGKMYGYQVKLCTNEPIPVLPSPIQHHLKTRVDGVTESMNLWLRKVLLKNTYQMDLQKILDVRNLNKALISNNYPISLQDYVRAQLSGASYFSKLDCKCRFWLLVIELESLALSVFNANNRLYLYTRPILGVKPAQPEINAALKQIFSHISNFDNDLIISAKTLRNIWKLTHEVIEVIKKKNLTRNSVKFSFGPKEIKVLWKLFSSEGVKPDPEKIKALTDLQARKTKKELRSFLCMMQSNNHFVSYFSKLVVTFRTILNSEGSFNWTI